MIPVTVLCNCRFPSTAAHSTYLARLCESLSGRGATVELVVPKRFKEIPLDPFSYYSVKNRFAIRKICSFDFIIFGSIIGRLGFFLQYVNFYTFTILFFLFRSRRRVIYTMDNLGCLLTFLGYTVVFETHIGIGSYRKRLLPLLKRADKFVVVNSMIKDDFVRVGVNPAKILVAPNGVDLSVFSVMEPVHELRKDLRLPIEAKIITYVGRYKTMGMDKGVDGLVRAFSALRIKLEKAYLLIVGLDTDEQADLAAVLNKHGVPKDAYSLVKHVPHGEVARFMRASDVLVMNYPNTDYYAREMSPMKMFEYMAVRRPIVTTDLPAVREILQDDMAVFVSPDNDKSLEQGIMKVLTDDPLGERFSERAYQAVLSYTWDIRAKRILEFISEKS